MISGWIGGLFLEAIVFAVGYFGAEWAYHRLIHAQFLPHFVTLHGFQMLLLGITCLFGGALFFGFLKQCHEDQRWGALLFGVTVSLVLAMPVGYLIADHLPKIPKGQKNQAWALLAVLGSIVVNGLPLWAALNRDELEAGRTDHLRGTEVMTGGRAHKEFAKLLKREIKRGGRAGIAFWGDSRLPWPKETQHILIVGSTGAGKSQVMYPIMEEVIARGDKAIIWDVKGTYTQAFAGRSQVGLLAPWDQRSLHWQLGADVTSQLDCHQLASAMIPEEPLGANQYFYDSPRMILETVFLQLHASGAAWGWKDLWDVIGQGQTKLEDFLNRSPEGRSIIDGLFKTKSIGEVYSNLMTSTRTAKWLAKAWPKEGISLKDWVTSTEGPQVLILGGIPQWDKLAGDTATFAIQTLVEQVLSLKDNPERRIWFFLDELASLGKMNAINRLSTMGRSKGACVVAGIQDLASIEKLYGREMAKSIANSFGSMIFMRCTEVSTSQWASEVIGEQEVREHQKSQSKGTHSGQHGSSSSSESIQQVTRKKAAFLASQIANLGDLDGIFRLAGWPVAHLGWAYNKLPQEAPLVQEAPWVSQRIELDPPGSSPKKEIPKDDAPPKNPDEELRDDGFNI